MEYRFNDGGFHLNGTGELLSGKGSAVLPEDFCNFDAFRLSKLGNAAAEPLHAFLVSFRIECCVTPLLQKHLRVFGLLLCQVLFPDKQKGDESLGRAGEWSPTSWSRQN